MGQAKTNTVLNAVRFCLYLILPVYMFFQYFSYIVATPRPPEISALHRNLAAKVRLVDVTKEAGIAHISETPDLPKELKHLPLLGKLSGFGVAVGDFDNDGWMDFYATSCKTGSPNRLYRNNHNGTFTDIAKKFGVADINDESLSSNAALWVDVDQDGWSDLLVVGAGCPKLFKNNRGKGFVLIPFGDSAGKKFCSDSQEAIALDYNGDSLPDIYVVNRNAKDWRNSNLDARVSLPSIGDAAIGPNNQLYENIGHGNFREVAATAGVTNNRWSFAAVAGDFNNDGRSDLFVANDSGKDKLYLNKGGKFFETADKIFPRMIGRSGMNAEAVDLNGRGYLDLYVSKVSSHPRFAARRNEFWVYDPDTKIYRNKAHDFGIDGCGWSWGGVFIDTQLRGAYDLIVVNGLDSGAEPFTRSWTKNSYLFTFASMESMSSDRLEDVRVWPPMKGRGVAGNQGNCFFYNTGNKFENIGEAIGWTPGYDGRAVALIDFDNNGSQDILISSAGGPLKLIKNLRSSKNNWVGFRIIDRRTKQYIPGARIVLTYKNETGEIKQRIQEVRFGNGFAAQSDPRLVFGLGSGSVVSAKLTLPNGKTGQLAGLKTNEYNNVVE
jgi:hypothetical protein